MLNLVQAMRVVVYAVGCVWLAGTGWLHAQNDGWIKQFGAVNSGANCVAVDVDPATGNVYALGAFAASTQNPFVIGTQSFTNSLALYVVSYTADGTFRWVRTLPANCNTVSPSDISYADGHVFFTGSFTNGSLSLGNNTVNTSGRSQDLFIGRVSATNGQPNWLLRGGGSRDDAGLAIKARNGIVMLGGYYNNSGVVAGFQLSSEGVNDDEGFIAFYSYSGSGNNAFSVGGTSGDFITAVDLADDGGYTYAGTTLSSSVDVAGNTFIMPSSGRQQLFVRKVDFDGFGLWFRGYASSNGDIESAKGRLSTSGSFLLTGTYNGSPALGSAISLPTKPPGSTGTPFTNGFWMEISATNGNITRAVALSGANSNLLTAIEQDPQTQDIYTVGAFGKTAQLGGKSLQSSAPQGVVIARFPAGSSTAAWAVTGEATTATSIFDVAIEPNVGVYGTIGYEGNFTMLDKNLVFNGSVEGALVKLTKTGSFNSLQCVTATAPTITTSGNATPCVGETVVLTASTIPQGATYRWKRNNNVINGATGRSINATESGTYSVEVVTGADGCPSVAGANTVTLTFQPAPAKPVISQAGNTLQTDVQADQYQWRDANGNAIPLAVNPTYNPPQSGRYSLTVRNANGCEATSDPITFTLGTSRGSGLAGSVRLWPNPVAVGQSVILESTVGERFRSNAFDLVDLSGRQHAIAAVERANGWELRTDHLPAGLYFIRNAGTVLGQVVVQER